jgi:hypothetical protein
MLGSRFNMSGTYLLVVLCAAMAAAPSRGPDSTFVHYRGVSLGDSPEVAANRLGVSPSEIRTVQERPTPVRAFTWRPVYRFGDTVGLEAEPRAAMVLTFHRDRLARIVVSYDRDQTRGMTDADLREALAGTYGSSMLMPRPTAAPAPAAPRIIGRWSDDETLVLLWREADHDQVQLTITAIGPDRLMQAALADGVVLETTEGPRREAAHKMVAGAAIAEQDRNSRRGNKATFKP